jgi:hypothetical protein
MTILVTLLSTLLAVSCSVVAYTNPRTVHFQRTVRSFHGSKGLYSSSLSESTTNTIAAAGSNGVELLKDYLNSPDAAFFVKKLVLLDPKVAQESEKLNFWSGESFTVKSCECTGIIAQGLSFVATCDVKGKESLRNALVPFPTPVQGQCRTSFIAYSPQSFLRSQLNRIICVLSKICFQNNLNESLSAKYICKQTRESSFHYDRYVMLMRCEK